MKKRHLFLTGEKRVGKSTVLQTLLQGRQVRLGGFRTVRDFHPDHVSVHMLPASERAACTPENRLFIRRGNVRYPVPENFDRLGCCLLARSGDADLIIMDELGPSEGESVQFQELVLQLLDGETPVYGVLQRGSGSFSEQIRNHPLVELITVTEENRDELPAQLRGLGW